MSLMDIFTENVNSRLLAVAFAVTSVVGLEGCSPTLARRVVTDSVIRGTYPARQDAARASANATKCAIGQTQYCERNRY